MNKQLFEKYADIKKQIKGLSDEAKEIEKEVMEEMVTQEVEQVKSDFGTFSFTSRKTWKYSENIAGMESSIKEAKKKEETDGTATFEEKTGLMFRGK